MGFQLPKRQTLASTSLGEKDKGLQLQWVIAIYSAEVAVLQKSQPSQGIWLLNLQRPLEITHLKLVAVRYLNIQKETA